MFPSRLSLVARRKRNEEAEHRATCLRKSHVSNIRAVALACDGAGRARNGSAGFTTRPHRVDTSFAAKRSSSESESPIPAPQSLIGTVARKWEIGEWLARAKKRIRP